MKRSNEIGPLWAMIPRRWRARGEDSDGTRRAIGGCGDGNEGQKSSSNLAQRESAHRECFIAREGIKWDLERGRKALCPCGNTLLLENLFTVVFGSLSPFACWWRWGSWVGSGRWEKKSSGTPRP